MSGGTMGVGGEGSPLGGGAEGDVGTRLNYNGGRGAAGTYLTGDDYRGVNNVGNIMRGFEARQSGNTGVQPNYMPTAPQSTAPSLYESSMVTPARTSAPATPTSDYYASMARPGQDNTAELLNSIYQQSLGRAPDAEGAQFWSNAAKQGGWNAQQLAANIQSAGAPERARTGYSSTLNPSTFGDQRVGPATAPSYYNTNPVGVDYANIFNPAARSVTTNQQTLTPGQQAQYLGDWTRHYSQSNRAATEAANLERKNTANAQWANYLNNKAKAEAAAPDLINKAVEEKLAGMGYGQNNSNDAGLYYGAFKAGGSVPGGLRSLKGKTKP